MHAFIQAFNIVYYIYDPTKFIRMVYGIDLCNLSYSHFIDRKLHSMKWYLYQTKNKPQGKKRHMTKSVKSVLTTHTHNNKRTSRTFT